MKALVRRPAVAGAFYPRDATALTKMLRGYLEAALVTTPGGSVPKAIIVPHAGYIYSGPIAASAYARVARARGLLDRVVILGPSHFVPLDKIAVSSASGFATPLGVCDVDVSSRDALVGEGLVTVSDQPHSAEHSLEVQLPFIQHVLGAVKVLPLVVGTVPTTSVEELLDRVWGGRETLVVVSTDLSHYHERETAEQLDKRTASAIVGRHPEQVAVGDACGVFALRGLVSTAARRDMKIELLDLRTSADTAGEPERVVGYGAFAIT